MQVDDIFGSNKLIDIELNFTVEKNKSGVGNIKILSDEESAKLKADEKLKDKVKTLRTQWVCQTWQAANELLKRASVYNYQTQQNDIDWTSYRSARLESCLVSWDATNAQGEPIPCNAQTINSLHATVALALLDKYDKAVSIDKAVAEKN